nr:hypothetical protein [uncultured Lachnoclostridium sp.]
MYKSQEEQCKDVFLICKGRYSSKKYNKTIDALNAYYKTYCHGSKDLSYRDVNEMFIYPMIKWIIENYKNDFIDPLLLYIFNDVHSKDFAKDYDKELFYRIIQLLRYIDERKYYDFHNRYVWLLPFSNRDNMSVNLD